MKSKENLHPSMKKSLGKYEGTDPIQQGLIELIKAKGVPITEIAKDVGISHNTIYLYLNNKQKSYTIALTLFNYFNAIVTSEALELIKKQREIEKQIKESINKNH